jgi:hypothetical protein
VTFIIRSQGFFYTDEYYAPSDVFRSTKTTYATKAEADNACAAFVRTWVRAEPLGNYLFDDHEPIDAVVNYMRTQWPDDDIEWDYELAIPKRATDVEVDEIVKRMAVVFAQVFDVDDIDGDDDDEDHGDDADEDDDDEADSDELHFGPS